jgi:transposase
MKIDSPPAELKVLEGVEIFNHGHLPAAAAFCRRLGLVEMINDRVHTEMQLSPGLVVQAMVLDALSGRSPLYRLKDFLATQDIELLLGEELPAGTFSDINIGRSLDAIFESGPTKIITQLGVRAVATFKLDASVASYDTTSTSLWGDYHACETDTPPPGSVIAYGHSKDHRPDLKQFMTELLCVDRGVPIFGRTLDGNASDKNNNNEILSRISSIMSKHGFGPGAFVYVADSAMVTKSNLEAVGQNLFISRLPANYKECERAIRTAVDSAEWTSIGCLSERPIKGNRASAYYKSLETSVILHEKTYRAVVIHSSSHDKRRQKKYDKLIANSEKSITKALKKLPKFYACEADAKSSAQRAEELCDNLHKLKVCVCPEQVRKRGRPPKNAPVPTRTRYKLVCELSEDTAAIQKLRELAGCFVLLTNVPIEGEQAIDSAGLLKTYKGQYGVESDFAFLKDPLVVNDVFLKTPSRIDVLGMVLVIALMIWRLMERSMRAYVKNTATVLPGWANRQTDKPTSFMMSTAVVGVMVARFGQGRSLLQAPKERPMAFLAAMGLDSSVFIDPQFKCTPIIPEKPG